MKKNEPKVRTKVERMRQAMVELADRHNMHIEFIGGSAMVTTIAGEWFSEYNQRPICLHHKNNETRFRLDGQPTGHYHIQKFTFPTPQAALSYIYRHERALERLAFDTETEEKDSGNVFGID